MARTMIAGALLMWALLPGCSGEDRASAEGESCGRTADCAAPLRCVDRSCLAPTRARHLIEARRGPAVPDGAEPAASGRPAPMGRGPAAATPTPAMPATSDGSDLLQPAAPSPTADAPGGGQLQ